MPRAQHHPAYVAMIDRLKRRRLDLGLESSDVERQLGVSHGWLHRVETCKRRLDFMETVDLCRLYRIKLHDLARCVRS